MTSDEALKKCREAAYNWTTLQVHWQKEKAASTLVQAFALLDALLSDNGDFPVDWRTRDIVDEQVDYMADPMIVDYMADPMIVDYMADPMIVDYMADPMISEYPMINESLERVNPFDMPLDECENCGIVGGPGAMLTNGFCECCTCERCGDHGTMSEAGGWCKTCEDLLVFPEQPEKYDHG